MAKLDPGNTGGGGDGGGGDETTVETDPDSLYSESFKALAPDWFTDNAANLKAFATDPVGAVIGAVLTQLFIGIETIVEAFIEALLSIFDSFAFIPTTASELLLDGGGYVARIVFEGMIALNDELIAGAEATGPLAPLVGIVFIVAEVIAVLWFAELLLKIIIDAIPGGGGLI